MIGLKKFISTTIGEFLNERYEIGNIPSNIVLLSILKNNSTKFISAVKENQLIFSQLDEFNILIFKNGKK